MWRTINNSFHTHGTKLHSTPDGVPVFISSAYRLSSRKKIADRQLSYKWWAPSLSIGLLVFKKTPPLLNDHSNRSIPQNGKHPRRPRKPWGTHSIKPLALWLYQILKRQYITVYYSTIAPFYHAYQGKRTRKICQAHYYTVEQGKNTGGQEYGLKLSRKNGARIFPRPVGARKNTTQLAKYPRVC